MPREGCALRPADDVEERHIGDVGDDQTEGTRPAREQRPGQGFTWQLSSMAAASTAFRVGGLLFGLFSAGDTVDGFTRANFAMS